MKQVTRIVSMAVGVCAIGALTLAQGEVNADEPSATQKKRPEITNLRGEPIQNSVRATTRVGAPPAGTIQYDNNVPFNRDGDLGGLVGNRFVAGVQDPHTFASASFRMANAYGGTAGLLILDVNTGAGTATTIDVVTVTGLTTGTANTHVAPLAGGTHTGQFIGGIIQTGYSACDGLTALNSALTCGGVALTQGNLTGGPGDPGQGFNAVRINVLSSTGIDIANQNAIFRVTGSNLPVELMSFAID
ncbi:MAG: hypothetical protein AAFX50_07205 [Acidobacteriota bacterium]